MVNCRNLGCRNDEVLSRARRFRVRKFLFVFVAAVAACTGGFAEDPAAVPARVVVLGTGNPSADPERGGPALAVVVNDRAYLIDCGPGVVRRAAAAERNGIAALKAKDLKIVFITHLHSDHTLGYPDLIFSPWVLGRKEELEAYGPHGLKNMTLPDTGSTCMRFRQEWYIATLTLPSLRFRLSMGYGRRLTDTRSRLTAARLLFRAILLPRTKW
jgi:ribonuclease BN (tRNA processing enzyme)